MLVALTDRFLAACGFSQRKQRVLHAAILKSLRTTNAGDHTRCSIPFLRVLALGMTTAVRLMGMRESMRKVRLVASRLTGQPCPGTHVPSLSATGCARLFRRALIRRIAPMPKRPKQVSILELIPCNGGPASGEWRGLACSESSLRTQDHNDSCPELLRWRRITETGSSETVACRMKKSV